MAGKNIRNIFALVALFACVFCLALPAAFAADGADEGGALQPAQMGDQVNAEEPDDLQYAEGELNLIQRGGTANSADGVASGISLSAQDVSDAQMEAFKARLNIGLMNVEESINVSDLRIPVVDDEKYLLNIISDIVNSNPDLFYVNTSVRYRYSSTGYYEIMPSYTFDQARVLELKASYEAALQQALSWVPDNATDVQKAKAIHDWLVRNCSYNTDAAAAGPQGYVNGWQPWTAYGAIVDKSPVCQGYSLAFISAMNRLGIQATYVSDDTHGWNRAVIDGSWFNLDVTHDDPLPDRGFSSTPLTTYFLKSDAWFKANPSGSHHTTWSPAGIPGTDTRYDSYTGTTWSNEGLVYSAAASHATVSSFELSHSALAVEPDTFGKIDIVNVQPAGASVYAATWTSSNPSAALVDSSGNVSAGKSTGTTTITCTINGISRTCEVQVRPFTTTITASNVSVCVGSTPDLLEGVTAVDDLDGDITSAMTVSPASVSTEKAGTYTVTYSVTNSRGAKTTKTITVTVKDHSWDAGVETLAPTCTATGSKTFTCSACGKTRVETVSALGHSYSNYTPDGNATCTQDGTKTATCDHGCGTTDTVTDSGSALGHSFTNYVSDGNAKCGVDGTKTATCDRSCGATDTIADPGSALSHSFTNYVSDHNAKCEVDGTKTAECDHGCGTTRTIADPGSAPGHSWNGGVVTVEPTYEKDGVRTYTCTTCGTTDTKVIPKLVKPSLSTATISGLTSAKYTGKAITRTITVTLDGKTLVKDKDYTVSFANNVNVGKAQVEVKGIGDYAGAKNTSFTIKQATNKMTVKSTSVKKTLKVKTLKKKTLSVALPKATASFGAAKWKVTSKDKKGVLTLSGKSIKVKKGAKKGTYTIKLKAYASKTKNYSAATSKTVTVKVTVK